MVASHQSQTITSDKKDRYAMSTCVLRHDAKLMLNILIRRLQHIRHLFLVHFVGNPNWPVANLRAVKQGSTRCRLKVVVPSLLLIRNYLRVVEVKEPTEARQSHSAVTEDALQICGHSSR